MEYPCPVQNCNGRFNSANYRINHINRVHKQDAIPANFTRCRECAQVCQSEKGLQQHIKRSHVRAAAGAEAPDIDNNDEENNNVIPRRRRQVEQLEDAEHHAEAFLNDVLLEDDEDFDIETKTFYSTEKLYLLNPSWKAPFHACVSSLLTCMETDDPGECYRNTVALLVLPGLLNRLRGFNKRPQQGDQNRLESPLDLLKRLAAIEDKARAILDTARDNRERLGQFAAAEAERGRRRGGRYNIGSLQRKIVVECGIGRYSKAARTTDTLEDALSRARNGEDPPALQRISVETATDIVGHLYPNADDDDELEPLEEGGDHIMVTPMQVQYAIITINRDKAPGCSAWSNTLLRTIGTHGSPEVQLQFAARLAAVFNRILSGRAPACIRDLWTDSKIALVAKDDPGEYRPLGIGEVFFRLLGKTVQSSIGRVIGQHLQPLQLAIGVAGGVEIAAEATALRSSFLQAQHTPGGFATMSIDLKNAFNSIRRKHILVGLRAHAPLLIPFFTWVYGKGIDLRWTDGNVIGSAATGCLQGDPLASLYFSVGIQSTLARLDLQQRAFEGELWRAEQGLADGEQPSEQQLHIRDETAGCTFAIADDVSIGGRTATVFRMAEVARTAFEPLGLQLNLRKSWILGSAVDTADNAPAGFRLTSDGAKTLGRPLGSAAFQRAWVTDRLERRQPPRSALQLLPCRLRLGLVKRCFNPRFDYLRKVCPFNVVPDEVYIAHDDRVDEVIWDMGATSRREELRLLRRLPLHLGGLGIPALVGDASNRHRVITYRRTHDFLVAYHPQLITVLDIDHPVHSDGAYRGLLAVDEQLDVDGVDAAAPAVARTLGEDVNSTRREVARRAAVEMQHLHTTLLEAGRTGHAATLLSTAAQGTGRWLSAPEYMSGRFTEEEYTEALRSRLLGAFEPPGGRAALPCRCGAHGRGRDFDLVQDPTHPTVCAANGGIVGHRHDQVREALLRVLRRVYPDDLVLKEPLVHDNPGGLPVRRPDILANIGGVEHAIDVVIAEPAAAHNIADRGLSSATVPEGAAQQAEKRKVAEYTGTLYADSLIPFALESTGRVGRAAAAFLQRVGSIDPGVVAALQVELSTILARNMGQLYHNTRIRLRGLRD